MIKCPIMLIYFLWNRRCSYYTICVMCKNPTYTILNTYDLCLFILTLSLSKYKLIKVILYYVFIINISYTYLMSFIQVYCQHSFILLSVEFVWTQLLKYSDELIWLFRLKNTFLQKKKKHLTSIRYWYMSI